MICAVGGEGGNQTCQPHSFIHLNEAALPLSLLFSAIVKVSFVEGSICTDNKRCHIHFPVLAFATFIISGSLCYL